MVATAEQLKQLERQIVRDQFADFERAVLQDNIVLCDAKSGVLLAFSGAMVIFCIDAFLETRHAETSLGTMINIFLLISAAVFLVSCHFSLSTVIPRLIRGRDDHIFWESSVFKLPVDQYIAAMEAVDTDTERRDKLHHVHMLASICRMKFRHFFLAIRAGQVGFLLLVATELARLAV